MFVIPPEHILMYTVAGSLVLLFRIDSYWLLLTLNNLNDRQSHLFFIQ